MGGPASLGRLKSSVCKMHPTRGKGAELVIQKSVAAEKANNFSRWYRFFQRSVLLRCAASRRRGPPKLFLPSSRSCWSVVRLIGTFKKA
jgi:hypothetical protein